MVKTTASLALSQLAVFLALALCTSGSNAQNHTTFNTRGIPYPSFRYSPWDTLGPSSLEDANVLGYTNVTWNFPGTNFIEGLAYESVEARSNATNTTDGEKSLFQALIDLGFDNETVYDCYVNHYEDYFWEEMSPVVVEAFGVLGWNSSSWNGVTPAPASEDKFWAALSPPEQQSAVELCYLPETWDGISLVDWTMDYASLAEEYEQEEVGTDVVVEKNGEQDPMEGKEIGVDADIDNMYEESASGTNIAIVLAGVITIQSTILLSLMW